MKIKMWEIENDKYINFMNENYPITAPKMPNSETKSTSGGGVGPPGRII